MTEDLVAEIEETEEIEVQKIVRETEVVAKVREEAMTEVHKGKYLIDFSII